MKRLFVLLFALLIVVPCRAEEFSSRVLLNDLRSAALDPSPECLRKIDEDLAETDDPVLTAVAERWKEVYLDPSFRLYFDSTDDPSLLAVPDPSKHAFVVLGFCLKDGGMEPELCRRCDAAAAAARAFPDSLLVCTGGPTGGNNPHRHTEAGLMRLYLMFARGIPSCRIDLDEEAMTTVENAVNVFRILRDRGIETITLVTSGYHMRWALMIFYAVAEQSRQDGYSVEIIGNWCCDVPPAAGYDLMNVSIAVSQLRSVLAD